MRHDPPEQAIYAMIVLTVLAVGFVWIMETISKLLR
jgi:hypothetical protein